MAQLDRRLELWVDEELDGELTRLAQQLAQSESPDRYRSAAARELMRRGLRSVRRARPAA